MTKSAPPSIVGGPDLSALSNQVRATLAAYWWQAGREEHASVAAFSELSLQLMALGAGPELLHAAHQAAIDELKHAERCLALASAYAGKPLVPGPLAISALSPAVAPMALALTALRDGCYGEAVAGRQAAAAAAAASDPAVVATLQCIARDEAAHAALGWRVVAFCRTLDERVDESLAEAAQALPLLGNQADPLTPSDAARAHGMLSSHETNAIARAVARELAERVATTHP